MWRDGAERRAGFVRRAGRQATSKAAAYEHGAGGRQRSRVCGAAQGRERAAGGQRRQRSVRGGTCVCGRGPEDAAQAETAAVAGTRRRGERRLRGGKRPGSPRRRRRKPLFLGASPAAEQRSGGPGRGPGPLPALSLVLAAVLGSRRRPPRPSAPVREGTFRRLRLPGGAGESPAEENSSIPMGLKGRGIRGGQGRDAERAGKKLGLRFCLCVVHGPCPDGVPASITHRISPGKSASALHLKEPDLTQVSVLLPSMFRLQSGQHRALRRALFCTDFYQTAATASKGRGCSQTLNKAKQLSNSNNHKNNKDDNTIRLEVGGLCPLSSCTQQTALIPVEFLPETGLQIGLVNLLYKGIKGTIPALSPVSCLCIPL